MSLWNKVLDSCGKGGRYCSCCNWSRKPRPKTNTKQSKRILKKKARRRLEKDLIEKERETIENIDWEAQFFYELEQENLDFKEEKGYEDIKEFLLED